MYMHRRLKKLQLFGLKIEKTLNFVQINFIY